jgi:hypothetical protein
MSDAPAPALLACNDDSQPPPTKGQQGRKGAKRARARSVRIVIEIKDEARLVAAPVPDDPDAYTDEEKILLDQYISTMTRATEDYMEERRRLGKKAKAVVRTEERPADQYC